MMTDWRCESMTLGACEWRGSTVLAQRWRNVNSVVPSRRFPLKILDIHVGATLASVLGAALSACNTSWSTP